MSLLSTDLLMKLKKTCFVCSKPLSRCCLVVEIKDYGASPVFPAFRIHHKCKKTFMKKYVRSGR